MFTDRSIWTMIHGIVLSGAALMALAAAVFSMRTMRTVATPEQSRTLAQLMVFIAATLWLAVLVGSYIIFPLYRVTPPAGATDLSQFPRSFLLANPNTAWLHAFAMEIKEHVPWIASMLATAAAFVGMRYRSQLLNDAPLRKMAMTLLAICFVLVSVVGLLGIFINKVAPLQ
ncbi:MAG: hypothetical protein HYX76_11220 [Acidobacteria bacterium]|nr:hypothetical protein [Acidobacteriota bacterium]